MKKRIMALFLAMTMVVAATGCGKGYKIGDKGEVYNDYITVKKWKGLEVERIDPVAVTDEDVQGAIDSDLQTLTSYVEVKDRGAKNGDQVTVDYVGKLDGVAFQNGTGSSTFILGEIKQGNPIEDFQKGIVGHKTGEEFSVPLTFPKDYVAEELAGKAVVFTMTLKKVEEIKVAELTDETAKKLNPKANNVEEYKALVRADLEKSNKESAEDSMRNTLFSLLSEQWDVKEYPKEELKEQQEEAQEYYEQEYESYLSYVASMYGMSTEDVKSSYGMTVEQFVSSMYGTTIEEMAKMQYALRMAMDLIAKVEKIKVDQEDMDAFLKKQADMAGYELDEYKEMLEEESDDEDELEEMIRKATFQEKILDFLWENCKIVEPKETVTE